MASPMQDDALRVKQLETKLAAVTAERNALEQDLEQLCLNRGGHMFSSSYVLAERLKFLETEVKQQRSQLIHLTTDRDNAQEDLVQVKALKRAADQVTSQAHLRPHLSPLIDAANSTKARHHETNMHNFAIKPVCSADPPSRGWGRGMLTNEEFSHC